MAINLARFDLNFTRTRANEDSSRAITMSESHYKLFSPSIHNTKFCLQTISILTSILVLSQMSANDDLLLPTVSSSSFRWLPLASSLFMLTRSRFPNIVRGKSTRNADLCRIKEHSIIQREFCAI